MARKKAKATKKGSEIDEAALVDIYTNKTYSAPEPQELETVREVEEDEAADTSSTKELNDGRRVPRRAARAAADSFAAKKVRRLDFAPYHVVNRDRERKRHQKVVKIAKQKGSKPYKWQGISPELEEHLIKLIEEDNQEEFDNDEKIINDAIDAHLESRKSNEGKPNIKTPSSTAKRVNSKRRKRSLLPKPIVEEDLFQFETTPEKRPKPQEERRDSFESALLEADLMFGPIFDENKHEQTAQQSEEPPKVFLKVRRSSRFFRSATDVPDEPPSGSFFTQVQIEPKKYRRKSRRSNFVLYKPSTSDTDEPRLTVAAAAADTDLRSPLSPIENII